MSPILDGPEPEPNAADEVREFVRNAVVTVTGGSVVRTRIAVFAIVAVLGSSQGPSPWDWIATLGVLGLTIEALRKRVAGSP